MQQILYILLLMLTLIPQLIFADPSPVPENGIIQGAREQELVAERNRRAQQGAYYGLGTKMMDIDNTDPFVGDVGNVNDCFNTGGLVNCDPVNHNNTLPSGPWYNTPLSNDEVSKGVPVLSKYPYAPANLASGNDYKGINSGNTSDDPVLNQTFYLTELLLQAKDVFPPSFLSSRTSGEMYRGSNRTAMVEKMLTESQLMQRELTGSLVSQPKAADIKKDYTAVTRDWVDAHFAKYCTGWEQEQFAALNSDKSIVCLTINSTSPRSIISGLDLKASALFSDAIPADLADASFRYVLNLTSVIPTPPASMSDQVNTYTLPAKYLTKSSLTDAGYSLLAAIHEKSARISLTQSVLTGIMSDHKQRPNLIRTVEGYEEVEKHCPPDTGCDTEPTIFKIVRHQYLTSRFGLLKHEASKRLENATWYDSLQQMTSPALLKEIAMMQALQLQILFKQYEMQEKQAAMAATMLSDLARMSYMTRANGSSGTSTDNPVMKSISNLIPPGAINPMLRK